MTVFYPANYEGSIHTAVTAATTTTTTTIITTTRVSLCELIAHLKTQDLDIY